MFSNYKIKYATRFHQMEFFNTSKIHHFANYLLLNRIEQGLKLFRLSQDRECLFAKG